jgi:uncharacterized protein YbjT (DUF2867 family)
MIRRLVTSSPSSVRKITVSLPSVVETMRRTALGVEVVRGDVLDAASVRAAAEGCEVLYDLV